MIAQLDKEYLRLGKQKIITRLIAYLLYEGRALGQPGRWINPVVFLNFRLSGILSKSPDISQPIFIVGTGRSGSTILSKILSIHKDVAMLNEPKAAWHMAFDSEDLNGSYSLTDAYYYLNKSHATNQTSKTIKSIYSSFLKLTNNKRIVDKYPELIYRMPFVKTIFPDAKFIFVVRDGWDAVASIDLWSQRKGFHESNHSVDWWGVDNRKWMLLTEQVVKDHPLLAKQYSKIKEFKRHQNMAAVEWICAMWEGCEAIQTDNSAMLMVKYEDLVDNPDSVLKSVANHCDLITDAKVHEYARRSLHAPIPKQKVQLDDCIMPAFEHLMSYLRY